MPPQSWDSYIFAFPLLLLLQSVSLCQLYLQLSFPYSFVYVQASHIITMRYSFLVAAFAAGASLVAAAPIEERQTYTVPGGDVTILNYALTLEYLERKFYMEGLAQFSHDDFVDAGFPDPFYDNLKEVYYDEMVALPSLLSVRLS